LRLFISEALTINRGFGVDECIGQHRDVNASLAHQFGTNRLLPGIPTDFKVAEAFGQGKPMREYAPNSRAADDYAAVVSAMEGMWT
jgi:chromosome partitioning protein